MLTKELLQYRRSKDKLHPSALDLGDPALLELARDLITIVSAGRAERRGALEAELKAASNAHKKPKLAQALCKLLLDRCRFEEAGPEAQTDRLERFLGAAAIFRDLGEETPLEAYQAQLSERYGPLEALGERLYDDLPDSRRLLEFDEPTPRALLARHNLAQVQGLVLFADRIDLVFTAEDRALLRRVFRWLKFCRLSAEIQREGDEFRMRIDGPGAVLDMQKRYGLQLAQFVAVVPLLPRWQLLAECKTPRGLGQLTLDEKSGLESHLGATTGYIPPEIEALAAAWRDERWQLETQPAPRTVGIAGFCVPDLELRSNQRTVAVELFHRWHRHGLSRRLVELEQRPDPTLLLGADQDLVAEEPALADHPQLFSFRQFPTRSKLKAALERLSPA